MKTTGTGQPDTPTTGPQGSGMNRLPALTAAANTVCPVQFTSAREKLAWEEFIVGVGPLTRIIYARAVKRFAEHLESLGLTVASATPRHIAGYIETLAAKPGYGQPAPPHPAAIRTRKQHLAAVRHFYHHLVQRHAAIINPAASVRSPRLVIERGETIAIRPDEVRRLLASIDTLPMIGQRDHAIIMVLSHTAVRVGAVARLIRGSIRLDPSSGRPRNAVLIVEEKNSKRRHLPLAGELREVLTRFIERLGPGEPDAPLFTSMSPHRPSLRPLSGQDILRMVRRRLRAAGLGGAELGGSGLDEVGLGEPVISCHSFRAGAATALLESGLELTRVQDLLGHADPRTTRMYDARSRDAHGETLERIERLLAG